MNAIDGTGLNALEELADMIHKSGRTLLLCGLREQPAKFLSKAEFHARIGEENLHDSLASAMARAKQLTQGL